MPLFEVETTAHIMIACVDDESSARRFAEANYPQEQILRISHRPRDVWVISKNLLGITDKLDPCAVARAAWRRGRPFRRRGRSACRACTWGGG